MSKNFGKFLLFSAVAGAAAYGAYSYLQKKEKNACPVSGDDTDDDFDDFSEDLDEDINTAKDRSYVSLNLDKAEAFASEAFHKAKEVITDSVHQVKETVKSVAEGQSCQSGNFTDLTPAKNTSSSEEKSDNSDKASQTAFADEDTTPDKAPASADASFSKPAEAAVKNASEKLTADDTVEEFFDDDDPSLDAM